jgi:CRP-like cAMP-binding protein
VSFFDYPRTNGEALTAEAAEVFLPDATEADWVLLLRHCRRRHVDAGETVIAPGLTGSTDTGSTDTGSSDTGSSDTARSLVFVVEGTLEVHAPGAARRDRLVMVVGPGSVLGEISFFDAAGRSALVVAQTPGEVAELSLAELEALAREAPGLSHQVLFDLGRTLARRLRATTRRAV